MYVRSRRLGALGEENGGGGGGGGGDPAGAAGAGDPGAGPGSQGFGPGPEPGPGLSPDVRSDDPFSGRPTGPFSGEPDPFAGTFHGPSAFPGPEPTPGPTPSGITAAQARGGMVVAGTGATFATGGLAAPVAAAILGIDSMCGGCVSQTIANIGNAIVDGINALTGGLPTGTAPSGPTAGPGEGPGSAGEGGGGGLLPGWPFAPSGAPGRPGGGSGGDGGTPAGQLVKKLGQASLVVPWWVYGAGAVVLGLELTGGPRKGRR